MRRGAFELAWGVCAFALCAAVACSSATTTPVVSAPAEPDAAPADAADDYEFPDCGPRACNTPSGPNTPSASDAGVDASDQ